jgi:hypothetical protein
MILPTTPSRAELTARAGQCLNRMKPDSFHRRDMTSWRDGLAQDRVPLTPDFIDNARLAIEHMEQQQKRLSR